MAGTIFLNHFNTENIDKKWNSFDAMLTKLFLPIVPIASAIGISLSRLDLREIVFAIVWIGSMFCAIGFLLPIAGVVFNYLQLLKYEKKIGKPIINGLLTK